MNRLFATSILVPAALLLSACDPAAPVANTASALPALPIEGAEWITAETEEYRGKRDDMHFATADVGFYGTGAGEVFRTDDGGSTWSRVWHQPGTFVRALGFVDDMNGFMGNVGNVYPGVTDLTPLYRTRDGGKTFTPVDIGGADVPGICAIDVLPVERIYQGELVSGAVIHAAGRVNGPAKLLRSVDGGETWSFIDMSAHAGAIFDVKFRDEDTGFVFASSSRRTAEANALILKTEDGGQSWREVYRSSRLAETSWKGFLVDDEVAYASVQSHDPERAQQVVAKSVDGGDSWTEMPVTMNAGARQFGIGFANRDVGWLGTMAGGFETRDGGRTWKQVGIARAANKFRMRAADGSPKIGAIGTEVQFFTTPSDAL